MNRVDVAIIGTGPAGISAALNVKIRNKSLMLFGNPSGSEKVSLSEEINNYPGFSHIKGIELNKKILSHIGDMGIEIINKKITGVYPGEGFFTLLSDQEIFEAKSVVLACGVESVKPIKGERELLGRGVSYCATCDGNLYRGKDIAVVCDTPELEEEVKYLSEIAGNIYYFSFFKSCLSAENVKTLAEPISEICGDGNVQSIILKKGRKIDVDGVFFLKHAVSGDVLLGGLQVEDGHIVTDGQMHTNIPGCFAAGDCVGRPYQLAKAIGEGNIAAHSALTYLAKKFNN